MDSEGTRVFQGSFFTADAHSRRTRKKHLGDDTAIVALPLKSLVSTVPAVDQVCRSSDDSI
jgi:hypothetical protein